MKKIFSLFFVLALVGAAYAVALRGHVGQVGGLSAGKVGGLARLPLVVSTPTAPAVCVVTSGIDGGRVNLRSCASTTCAALDILTEGEPLTVITAGAWVEVQTPDGLTGFVYSDFCKGR